jgi:hypothetical protein
MDTLTKTLRHIHEDLYGFISQHDLSAIVEHDRLRQLLIRCGACRLVCAAQDAEHLVALIESGKDAQGHGDHVRDVSLLATDPASHGDYQWRCTPAQHRLENAELAKAHALNGALRIVEQCFTDDRDYGGAFDGFCVTSDADSGL